MTKERFLELESLLTMNCHKYESDCTTCPYRKECEEYGHAELASYNSICYRCKKWLRKTGTTRQWRILRTAGRSHGMSTHAHIFPAPIC